MNSSLSDAIVVIVLHNQTVDHVDDDGDDGDVAPRTMGVQGVDDEEWMRRLVFFASNVVVEVFDSERKEERGIGESL